MNARLVKVKARLNVIIAIYMGQLLAELVVVPVLLVVITCAIYVKDMVANVVQFVMVINGFLVIVAEERADMKINCGNCNTMSDVVVLSTKTIMAHSIGYPSCPVNIYTVICENCNTIDEIALVDEINAVYAQVQNKNNAGLAETRGGGTIR